MRRESRFSARTRELGEVRLIARKVKQLLTDGPPDGDGLPAAPGDVVVVFRSLQEAAPLVREVFEGFGIPLALELTPALADAPLSTALVSLLRLVEEDWPFRRLLATLNNNYLRPGWPEWKDGRDADQAERLIRRLQIPSGAEQTLTGVQRLGDHLRRQRQRALETGDEDAAARLEGELDHWLRGGALLRRLRQALEVLPKHATQAGWRNAIVTLADDVGLRAAIDRGADPRRVRHDRNAWQRLLEALDSGDALLDRLGQPPPEVSLSELIDWLIDVLQFERLPREHDEVGRVRVLSASSVRSLSAPYVFVAGLTERAFPAPERQDRLYGETEYHQLRDARLPLPTPRSAARKRCCCFTRWSPAPCGGCG